MNDMWAVRVIETTAQQWALPNDVREVLRPFGSECTPEQAAAIARHKDAPARVDILESVNQMLTKLR